MDPVKKFDSFSLFPFISNKYNKMLFVFEGVQLILIIGYSQNEENEKTSEFECFFLLWMLYGP